MDSHSTNRGSIHSTMATNAIPEPNGLTDQQINTIEQTHGFTFNQQHKAFLKQYGAHNSFKTTYRYFDPNEHADQGCPADFEGAYFRVPWVHLWSVAGDDEIPSADLLWTEDDDVAEANIDRYCLHILVLDAVAIVVVELLIVLVLLILLMLLKLLGVLMLLIVLVLLMLLMLLILFGLLMLSLLILFGLFMLLILLSLLIFLMFILLVLLVLLM
eukprot:TRINITY_DN2071_c1_g1_i2.p1 TRINITY_DN2071_c1_g1~~TRINITY_DN2071_c1_g1_i2.p1  ORF type:complete len:215 (-),score=37.53 TRINITY_DN2071_c1_g1_i2:127-771(-)